MATNKRDNPVKNDERIAILEKTVSHVHETLERLEKNISKGFDNVGFKIK